MTTTKDTIDIIIITLIIITITKIAHKGKLLFLLFLFLLLLLVGYRDNMIKPVIVIDDDYNSSSLNVFIVTIIKLLSIIFTVSMISSYILLYKQKNDSCQPYLQSPQMFYNVGNQHRYGCLNINSTLTHVTLVKKGHMESLLHPINSR